jgi:hypothetical protein
MDGWMDGLNEACPAPANVSSKMTCKPELGRCSHALTLAMQPIRIGGGAGQLRTGVQHALFFSWYFLKNGYSYGKYPCYRQFDNSPTSSLQKNRLYVQSKW